MIKAKDWNGKDLKGTWEVTLKIDGVRGLWVPECQAWYSRASKQLYNVPPADVMGVDAAMEHQDVEVYHHDSPDQKVNFKNTIRAVRSQTIKTKDGCSLKRCKCYHGDEGFPNGKSIPGPLCKNWEVATPILRPEHLYSLDPLDQRLRGGPVLGADQWCDPTAPTLHGLLSRANAAGYEGLVLRRVQTKDPKTHTDLPPLWIKVKPKPTYDVKITAVIEGVGKRKGHVGAFMTSKGKVGGFRGFSYQDLKDLWEQHVGIETHVSDAMGVLAGPLVGQIIEVECMGLTSDGQFRHPRCLRFRPDKVTE